MPRPPDKPQPGTVNGEILLLEDKNLCRGEPANKQFLISSICMYKAATGACKHTCATRQRRTITMNIKTAGLSYGLYEDNLNFRDGASSSARQKWIAAHKALIVPKPGVFSVYVNSAFERKLESRSLARM